MMKKIVLGFALSINIFTAFAQSQWDTNPATANNPVITTPADEQQKLIVTDGANGAIVISQSYNTFAFPFLFAITAQKINAANGVVQWGTSDNPKTVFSKEGEATDTTISLAAAISDGNGGAYVAWRVYIETETDTLTNNYIQHINSSGNIQWVSTGLKVNSDIAGRSSEEISLCQDGSGGLVVVWAESVFDHPTQFTTFSQVYAQRYNSAGSKQWGTNAVQVCTAAGLRAGSTVVNDGSNGFVIYFGDVRNSNHFMGPDGELFDNIDIYAQKLNNSGALQWAAAGVSVANAALNQVPAGGFENSGQGIVADGAGGTIILINQYKLDSGDHTKYLAQRLNGSGAKQWAANGVSVCNLDSTKFLTATFSDGANGMVAAWTDLRNPGGFLNSATYAQRILAGGTVSWATDGINVLGTPAANTYYFTSAATDDGSGNYIFTWNKASFADGSNEIIAKKINNSGAQQWGTSPKSVCTNPDAAPQSPSIIKSNNGSAIIAWLDSRNNTGLNLNGIDIFAAKIAADGSLGGGSVVTPTTYTFTGTGNWNVAGNWSNSTIPPSPLPSGSTIVINPSSGSCTLNVSQTISAGATLTVMSGKNLIVPGVLSIQ